ncbi:MAG: DUF983 domain-containing protein [Chloroflexota bacterium]
MNFRSILQGKCPHCHKAHIFKTFWRMKETCDHCHIRFQRESGYFSMSIFIGYILGAIVALPGLITAIVLGLSLFWITVIPIVCVAITAPWIFRYARIVWLHVDEWIDPRRVTPEG